MQVEDVAREGLAARRAAQQQRHLPVGVGVLGQVVVDAEGVAPLVGEVLAHGRAGVRSDVAQGGPGGRRGHDDDRVFHGAVLLEAAHQAGHSGGLLADGHVDADDVLALLVDDGVQGDGRLAGAAVADDEFALAAADGDHRVDGFDTGLQRLFDLLPVDDARGLELDRPELGGLDRALVVERHAQRVDHPADERFAHRAPG